MNLGTNHLCGGVLAGQRAQMQSFLEHVLLRGRPFHFLAPEECTVFKIHANFLRAVHISDCVCVCVCVCFCMRATNSGGCGTCAHWSSEHCQPPDSHPRKKHANTRFYLVIYIHQTPTVAYAHGAILLRPLLGPISA